MKLTISVFFAVAPLALVGCASGSSEGRNSTADGEAISATTAGPAADEQEVEAFRAAADAICADMGAFAETDYNYHFGGADVTDEATFRPGLEALLDSARETIPLLHELVPPAGSEDAWAEVLTIFEEKRTSVADSIARLAAGENRTDVYADDLMVSEGPRAFRLEEATHELGLTVCGARTEAPSRPAPTATSPPAATVAPAPEPDTVVALDQFTADLDELEEAFDELRGLVVATGGVGRFGPVAERGPSALDQFEAAADRMAAYSVDDAAAEAQRQRVAGMAGPAADVLRLFIDAAASSDEQDARDLYPLAANAVGTFGEIALGR